MQTIPKLLQHQVDWAYHEYLNLQEEQGTTPAPKEFLAETPSEVRAPLATVLADHNFVVRVLQRMSCRLAPGARLGKYVLSAEIGRGELGVVWAAQESVAGRNVAIKVLRGLLEVSTRSRQRLEEAVAGAQRLQHPSLVQIYEVYDRDGVLGLVQEYVPGGYSVQSEIESFRGVSTRRPGYFRETARRTVRVAQAIQALHQAGLTHGNLKPSNILLTEEGDPKVSDLGMDSLRYEPRMPRSSGDYGLPYVLSPEQAQTGRVTTEPLDDVFAMGATLYEMLTWNRPFRARTEPELARMVLSEAMPAPHRACSQVPSELSRICMKALERNPGRRYASMAHLALDLTDFLAEDSASGQDLRASA